LRHGSDKTLQVGYANHFYRSAHKFEQICRHRLRRQNVGYSNFSQPQSHLSFCVLLQYLVERRRVVTQLGKLDYGRSASLQRTFKKSFTSFSHCTRNKTRDCLISVSNIRALNGRFNTSITHAYSIVIGSKHITLNATGGGFLTASKQFRHGATSKSRSNTASNSTKHKSPHLSGWRQIISLIT